jgi:prepilin-type N-terminal cleavage/methylation domain-containing protein/prepilin-type processing-associated H-X9-DG protein
MFMRLNTAKPMRPGPHAGRRAFTLVELLVVIAIVALLAALLLPVLSRAKAQSQAASCKNRLRQIGLSLGMYLADHRRYPPMWGQDTGSFQTWADRLSPYAPLNWTNTSRQCPAYTANGGIIKVLKQHKEVSVHTGYSYNGFGIAGLSGSPRLGLGIRYPPSLASEPEVRVPTDMYAVADARTYRDLFIFGEGLVKGLSGFIEMQPYYSVKEETPPLHGKGYNILFADGHAKLVRRSDCLFPPRTARNWNRDDQPHPEAWAPRNQWAVQN